MNIVRGRRQFGNLDDMLFEYIFRQCDRHFRARERAYARLSTPAQFRKYQKEALARYRQMIGPFPPKTPLNPRITGIVERDGYRIEKVIYESRPQFYVTANLYLPTGHKPPFPGILFPCGHSLEGKAYPDYQRCCIGLAKKGYLGLIYDPWGQGERLQYWDDPRARSVFGGPGGTTDDHSMAGQQCYLTGRHSSNYFVWDGIRGVDYLVSRPEVDPRRIGCTGQSGGGTQTAYIAPAEPRIKAARPTCYINYRRNWMLKRAPHDTEQNLVGCIPGWIDHVELCAMVAPRPVQIGAAIQDYFPIEGARETCRQAKRMYQAFGVPERMDIAEDDVAHSYSPGLRQAMYAWFNRWFGKEEEGADEPPLEVEPERNLWCTKTGQISTSLPEVRRVFDLNRDLALKIMPQRKAPRSQKEFQTCRRKIIAQAKELMGYSLPRRPMKVEVVKRLPRKNYRVEHLVLKTEPGIVVPGLLMVPEKPRGPKPAVLYVGTEIEKAGDQEKRLRGLVQNGLVALAIDPRGMGETREAKIEPREFYNYYKPEYTHAYNAFMLGRTLFGMRLVDVMRASDYLRSRQEVDGKRVAIAGQGMGGLLAIYAGALDRKVSAVASIGALATYRTLVLNPIQKHHSNLMIPGVLAHYDLLDLAACLAPRPLLILNATDHMKHRLQAKQARAEYQWTSSIYSLYGGDNALEIGVAQGPERCQRWLLDTLGDTEASYG